MQMRRDQIRKPFKWVMLRKLREYVIPRQRRTTDLREVGLLVVLLQPETNYRVTAQHAGQQYTGARKKVMIS